VVLSIVGLDRLPDDGHYTGKRAQEHLALSGPVPASVVRATQFFDFAAQMVSWMRRGRSAALPPLLLQPVAVTDVADVLVEVAVGEPVNGICELAGPETQDLIDMAYRTLVARGEALRLIPHLARPVRGRAGRRGPAPGTGRADHAHHLRRLAHHLDPIRLVTLQPRSWRYASVPACTASTATT
jgi:uncharacterized protein YbjT (DUF2867 family)